MKKRAAAYAVPLATVAAAGFDEPAQAGDLFLKLGNLEGESTEGKFKNWIDVLAWSWGASNNAGEAQSGGGGGKIIPSFDDIKIIKGYDKASPELMVAVAQGTSYPDAELSVNRFDGNNDLLEYMKVSLENVIVSRIAIGTTDQDDNVAETLTLNFSKIEVEYTQFDEQGKQTGSFKGCFDLKLGKSC